MQAEQATTKHDSDEPRTLYSLYISILVMCSYLLVECLFSMSTGTMSLFPCGFYEMDAIVLEFAEDLDNLAGGSSSTGNNSGESNNGTHFILELFQLFF